MNGLSTIVFKSLGVLFLVLLNGFFVAAELALVKIRDTQVSTLAEKGDKRARLVRLLIANLDSTISATQLGITLASLGLGIMVEPVFNAILDPVFNLLHVHSESVRHTTALLTGFLVNCFLLIVVGELTPKAIAIRQTLPVALWTARPLSWFAWLAHPFVWSMNHSALWLLRRMGMDVGSGSERHYSEDEIRLLLKFSQGRGNARRIGRDVVLNAMDLPHRIVREVMRPRREIVALSTAASMAECLDIAEKSRYSRFPLCQHGDLDNTLGVVHFKDLFAARLKARNGADLAPYSRKLIYVPETARLEKVLQLFQDKKLHLAVVVDEYGGTIGMVTLENILEELVGQIQDEFDQEKPLLTQLGADDWEIAGALPLHQLAGLIQETIPDEDVATVSGWVTHRMGGFPKPGDKILFGKHELRVEEMDELRVAKLRLTKIQDENDDSTQQTKE